MCCFRPWHPDGYPVIDRVAGLDNAWLTSGHFRTGILMAPATAQIITGWIASGQPPPEAAAWSSARFGYKLSNCFSSSGKPKSEEVCPGHPT